MPDFSTLQQMDQGQYVPPAAVVANPPSAVPPADVPPVSSWLAPGLPQPSDDAITVVGPATAARYQNSPPAPPAATLKGDDAQRAVDDYATYLNWRRENMAAPGSKAAQTPLALVTPGTNPSGGLSAGSGIAAAPPLPAGKFGLAPSKADQDALAKVMALDAASSSPPPAAAAAPGGMAGANVPATGNPASNPPSPAPPAAPDAGMVGNLAAGVNKGIASTLGAPVDLVTGAINLVPRGINAVAGTHLSTLPPAVGGSQWLMSAMGLLGADPRSIQPQGPAEQLAQGVGEGIGAAVTPLGAAGQIARAGEAIGPVASGVARTLAEAPVAPTAMSGAAAGAGGTVASDVARHEGVPEQYIPLIETAGQMAGGVVPVAGTAATMLAARGVRSAYDGATSTLPMGELAPMVDANGQPFIGADGKPIMVRQNMIDNAASTAARRAGMSPDDLAASLFAEPPNVPGAQPSAGQLTGNRGLLGMERNLTTASEYAREAFSNRRVAQNNAQVSHLANLSAQDAQASAAGNYFVNRLDQIDQQEAAAVARLQAAYKDAVSRVGGVVHPGDIGADMQGHIAARRAPTVKAADEAVNQAEGNVRYMARAIGGEQSGTDAQTVIQGYGQALRDGLAAVEDEANQERRALYAARDPDGKLAISAEPIAVAARRLEAELRPAVNQKFGSYESDLIDTAKTMTGVMPMADISAFRQDVNAALKEATAGANTGVQGAAKAVRRLTILKQAVDQAEFEATERAASKQSGKIASGAATPETTVVGRLATHASGGDRAAPGTGSAVFTPSGRRIDVGYRVVEASNLRGSHDADMAPNPAFPQELQPRDRTRAASGQQVQRIAGNLQPERLGASASAGEGAPIVGPDGVVESGNARYLAIRQAHAQAGEQAAAYRRFLAEQGYDVAGMKEPILVRERLTQLSPEDRVKFTQEANASTGLALSAGERAKIDASRLPDETLALFRPGDVTAAANRDFVRSFMQHAIEKGEEGSIITRDGGLSLDGAQRIRNALLHKAYGDPALVSALAESGDDSIKAFGGALMDAAGPMARLRTEVQGGHVSGVMDISGRLADAARTVAQAKMKRISLRDMVAQQDVFGGGVSEGTAELLRAAFGENYSGRISRQKFAGVLTDYAEEALKQSTEARLFGRGFNSETHKG